MWLLLIYFISVILLISILFCDSKKYNIPLTLKEVINFYGFDVIWCIVPIINTVIVLIYLMFMLTQYFNKKN